MGVGDGAGVGLGVGVGLGAGVGVGVGPEVTGFDADAEFTPPHPLMIMTAKKVKASNSTQGPRIHTSHCKLGCSRAAGWMFRFAVI